VYCWGANGNGELGLGDTMNRLSPTLVPLPAAATDIAAGNRSTCAKLSTGPTMCWGVNEQGQLGNGTFTDSTTPVASTADMGATSIGLGSSGACSIVGGQVRCRGRTTLLANGDNSTSLPAPLALTCD
jgi:hypothetical protein